MRQHTWVWAYMAAMGVYHVVVLPSVLVLGPVLAEQDWPGAANWSTAVAAFGLGSFAGNACAYRLRPTQPLAVAAAALTIGTRQAAVIGSGAPLVMIALLEAVTGAAVSLFFVLRETALQTHVPDHALSRVNSFDYLLATGLMPLGLALAGPVSTAGGVRATLFAMTALSHPCALELLAVPAVRRLPAQAPPVGDAARAS
ncbi:hypothetical protein [Streptomyces sp. NPDC058701]|uniref:hypothetical protein n=1 Tax=Streptomyces sp. NPDC058701 TaxID=3346608 RepID=UPI0036600533